MIKRQSPVTVPLKGCVQYVQDDGTGSTYLQSFCHSSEPLRMTISGHCPFKPFVIYSSWAFKNVSLSLLFLIKSPKCSSLVVQLSYYPFMARWQSPVTVPLKGCVQYVQDDDGTGSTFLQSFCHPGAEPLPFYGKMTIFSDCPFKWLCAIRPRWWWDREHLSAVLLSFFWVFTNDNLRSLSL